MIKERNKEKIKTGQAKKWKQQATLQIMALPAVICLLLFSIYPLFGLQIAFKDYKLNMGIMGSEWAGLKCSR